MRIARLASLALVLLALLAPLPVAFADGPAPAVPAAPSMEERETVRRMVAELREEASRLRGLAWKADVPADLLTRDQLYENIRALVREDYPLEKQLRDEKILRRVGLLEEGQDSVEMMLAFLKVCVAGYYEPKTKRLYIVEGDTGEAQKPTMLHELIHALEDQYYDLEGRLKAHEEDPDRSFAESCLGEGSAEHARLLYQEANPRIAALYERSLQDPELGRRQEEVLKSIPSWMYLPEFLHYMVGPALVKEAVGSDYAGGMNRLYEAPPTSQEQWMHPEKWLGKDRDLPRSVVWSPDLVGSAGPGWTVLRDWPYGELDLQLYLSTLLPPEHHSDEGPTTSQRAAWGWDAGRDLFLEREGRASIWIGAGAFDSPRDAAEAGFALADALGAASRGTIRTAGGWSTTKADGRARLTRDYRTANGRGRILVRGDEVLYADGVPDESFDAVWAAVERTTVR